MLFALAKPSFGGPGCTESVKSLMNPSASLTATKYVTPAVAEGDRLQERRSFSDAIHSNGVGCAGRCVEGGLRRFLRRGTGLRDDRRESSQLIARVNGDSGWKGMTLARHGESSRFRRSPGPPQRTIRSGAGVVRFSRFTSGDLVRNRQAHFHPGQRKTVRELIVAGRELGVGAPGYVTAKSGGGVQRDGVCGSLPSIEQNGITTAHDLRELINPS